MGSRLEGKVASVTGAGRGIGRSIALAYAREGSDIAATARTAAELDAVAAEISAMGREVLTIPADLADPCTPESVASQTLSRFGTIDILVNNAGVGRLGQPATAAGIRRSILEPVAGAEPDGALSSLQSRPADTAQERKRAHHQHCVHRRQGRIAPWLRVFGFQAWSVGPHPQPGVGSGGQGDYGECHLPGAGAYGDE